MTRPPGLSTRYISASAAFGSATLRRPKLIATASNSSSPNGRLWASAWTNSMFLCRLRPSSIIPAEKSTATTRAPERARAAELVPVPAATSRIRSPGCGATARTIAIRHSAALPTESTAFVRS